MEKKTHKSVSLNLSKICGILCRVRYNLTGEALRSIYYSLCYPYIIYCLSVWGCTWPSTVKEVFIAQKKIVRTITFKAKQDHTDLLFKDLGLLKFEFLKKYFLLLQIYNDINNNDDSNKLFTVLHHSHGTRGNNINLICPQARTTIYKCSMHCVGPICWNSLPNELRNITNYNTFKTRLKTYFFQQQNLNHRDL